MAKVTRLTIQIHKTVDDEIEAQAIVDLVKGVCDDNGPAQIFATLSTSFGLINIPGGEPE